jgi:hypothetical protein
MLSEISKKNVIYAVCSSKIYDLVKVRVKKQKFDIAMFTMIDCGQLIKRLFELKDHILSNAAKI